MMLHSHFHNPAINTKLFVITSTQQNAHLFGGGSEIIIPGLTIYRKICPVIIPLNIYPILLFTVNAMIFPLRGSWLQLVPFRGTHPTYLLYHLLQSLPTSLSNQIFTINSNSILFISLFIQRDYFSCTYNPNLTSLLLATHIHQKILNPLTPTPQ